MSSGAVYGHRLAHVLYARKSHTWALAIGVPTSALVSLICLVVDIDIWQRVQLASKEERCALDPGIAGLCAEFGTSYGVLSALQIVGLFGTTVALATSVGFVVVQWAVNGPLDEVFDVLTVERAIDGTVTWAWISLMCFLLLAHNLYRFLVFPMHAHSEELYPDTADQAGFGMAFFLIGSGVVTLALSVWACRRVGKVAVAEINRGAEDHDDHDETVELVDHDPGGSDGL